MKANWSVWSLGRWVWTPVWVFLIATYCKRLINGLVFVWRSSWVLLFPTLYFTCARAVNSIQILWALFPWRPQEWMLGGPHQYERSWWTPWHRNWRYLQCLLWYGFKSVKREVFQVLTNHSWALWWGEGGCRLLCDNYGLNEEFEGVDLEKRGCRRTLCNVLLRVYLLM